MKLMRFLMRVMSRGGRGCRIMEGRERERGIVDVG